MWRGAVCRPAGVHDGDLGTCTVTHITELRTTRELVAAVIGQDAVSQVLIRVGIAPTTNDAPATPRRPLDDVLQLTSPD